MLSQTAKTISAITRLTPNDIKNSLDNLCVNEILVKILFLSISSVKKSHFEQINEYGFPAMNKIPGGIVMPMQYCHHLNFGSKVP